MTTFFSALLCAILLLFCVHAQQGVASDMAGGGYSIEISSFASGGGFSINANGYLLSTTLSAPAAAGASEFRDMSTDLRAYAATFTPAVPEPSLFVLAACGGCAYLRCRPIAHMCHPYTRGCR